MPLTGQMQDRRPHRRTVVGLYRTDVIPRQTLAVEHHSRNFELGKQVINVPGAAGCVLK